MFNRVGKSLYHRGEEYASNAKERENEEETRFARDRFSLPTGGDSDGTARRRPVARRWREENLKRNWVAGKGTGMPVNVNRKSHPSEFMRNLR